MPFGRLLTVRYFSAKIVEIERFALRAAILHECQNYLKDGVIFKIDEKTCPVVQTPFKRSIPLPTR